MLCKHRVVYIVVQICRVSIVERKGGKKEISGCYEKSTTSPPARRAVARENLFKPVPRLRQGGEGAAGGREAPRGSFNGSAVD